MTPAACGSAKRENRYERAAVQLVQGFGKHIKVRSVSCTHIHGDTATCALSDTNGTSYSCMIQLGQPTYSNTGCFWSRAGAGEPP